MLRKLALVALAIGLCGCGEDAERQELLDYVDKMKAFDPDNRRVVDFIRRLDDPSIEITAADLEAARRLIDEYIQQVQAIPSLDIDFRELRVIHDLYGRKLAEAKAQAQDSGRELKRERGNVAIGMRHVEKMTDQHYKAIDVLWLRKDFKEALPLKWPD
jgi:spore cortex formation protein SpoVR/YcgB (stage V sporulation)